MNLRSIAQKLIDFLSRWTKPDPEMIVLSLIMGTSSLELTRDEFVELAPVKGSCGPFKLSGVGLPVFRYRMYDREYSQFVGIRVEVSRPDKMVYTCKIESEVNPERHGESVECKEEYKKPFILLSEHLHRYFGLYVTPAKRGVKQ